MAEDVFTGLEAGIDQWAQRRRDAATAATRLKAFDLANVQGADPSTTPTPLAAALGQGPGADPSFNPAGAQPAVGPATAALTGGPGPIAPAASPLPSIAGVQGAPSGSGIGSMLTSLNDQYGLPPGYLTKTAGIESNFNANAHNKGSGAAGPFQFVPSTAAAYGVSNPYDWADSARGAAQLAADNANVLRKTLGQDPTAGQLYLAHQQGGTGAAKLLANPTARAGDIVGDAAVRANGGDPNMPAGQFAAKWTSRFDGAGPQQQQAAAGPGPAMGAAMPLGMRAASAAAPSAFGDLSGASFPGAQQQSAPPQPSSLQALAAGAGGTSAPVGIDRAAFANGVLRPQPPQSASLPALAAGSGSGTQLLPQSGSAPPSALGFASGPNPPSAPGQQAIAGATDGAQPPNGGDGTTPVFPPVTNHGQGGFPDASTPTRVSSDPRSPGTFPGSGPVGQAAAAGTATSASGQPYGSVPLMIQGRMLTRQQAEDQLGDHDLYDDAAEDAKLIPDSSNAPPFVNNPGGATAALSHAAQAARAAPLSPQGGSSGTPTASAPFASPALPAAAGVRAAGIPREAIRILLADPTTAADGMKLWEQTATGKDYGFVKADDGSYWRQDPRTGAFAQLTNPIQAPYTLSAGQSRIGSDNTLLRSLPASGNDATKKVVQIGEDQFGNKRFGVFDSSSGTTTPLNPDGTAVSSSPSDSGATAAPSTPAAPGAAGVMALHGPDFLATLDPATAGQVQAIVEGRAPYPTGMLLKTPYGQRLAQYVTQTDPTFESGNATNRNKVRADFETGGPNSVAGAITTANTAIGHLGELSDAAQQLNNGSLPFFNSVGNTVSTAFGGKAVTDFNNIVGKYVEEATKFYRGTGGTESDIQRDIGNLSPNMSPTQLNSAIATQAALMKSKVDALQQRWRQGMGPLVQDFPIIQPKTAQVLGTVNQRAGIAPPAASSASPTSRSQGARVQVRSVTDYRALPSGTRYLDPNGTPRIKP